MKILCAVDLSDFAAPVLTYGVALARSFGADVAAVHVLAVQVPEARDEMVQELRALVEPFASNHCAIHLHVAEGDAATEILRYAGEWGAGLIIIGTHGRSGFDRFALGSVAEKVLRKASCPVLTLPPQAPRRVGDVLYHHILCPTDFSTCSERAVDFAVDLAVKAGAPITLLHVVDSLDGDDPLNGPSYVAELRRRQCEAEQKWLRAMAGTRASTGARIAEAVVVGRPHREIVRAATDRQADLIVMGVRGRGPVDVTLFGSTANQVVRRAACPVITVREQ